jgi:protein-disulfide isomerase
VAGGAIVAVVLAAAGMVGGGSKASGTGAAQASPSPAPSGADAGASPVLGDPAAPVLVEVWADYQCPFCGVMAHAIEPSLVRDFVETGRIRLVFRDFAFLGGESVEAAAAARCAGRQDAYWRYHDLLFASQRGENQGAFAPESLAQLAGFADLDTDAFAACMDGREAHGAALAETEAGRALDVSSTPTLHIVGPKGSTFIKGVAQLSAIETAIQQTIDGTVPSPTPEPAASGLTTPGASGSPLASPSGEPATPAP